MVRIQELLDDSHPSVTGRIRHDQVVLDIVKEESDFFSPQLAFRVELNEEDESQTIIAGLIGPRPAVWSLFMFVYFSVGTVGFFASSYGLSKYMLDEYSHAIWAFPIAILFMLTAYKAGKYGESLCEDQIEILKNFVRKAVNLTPTATPSE